MKPITLGVLILVGGMMISSCKRNTTQKKSNAEEKTEMKDGFVKGEIVTARADKGCPLLVRVRLKGEEKLHRPISLPEEFAEDGMVIQFKYRISRAPQKDCEEGMPLVVSEVSKIE